MSEKIEETEKYFKNWLKKQPQKGNPNKNYSDKTIDNILSNFRGNRLPQVAEDIGFSKDSLSHEKLEYYTKDNLVELREIQKKYEEYNLEKGIKYKQNFKMALDFKIKYLEEQN
jgi:hypothetical protein